MLHTHTRRALHARFVFKHLNKQNAHLVRITGERDQRFFLFCSISSALFFIYCRDKCGARLPPMQTCAKLQQTTRARLCVSNYMCYRAYMHIAQVGRAASCMFLLASSNQKNRDEEVKDEALHTCHTTRGHPFRARSVKSCRAQTARPRNIARGCARASSPPHTDI